MLQLPADAAHREQSREYTRLLHQQAPQADQRLLRTVGQCTTDSVSFSAAEIMQVLGIVGIGLGPEGLVTIQIALGKPKQEKSNAKLYQSSRANVAIPRTIKPTNTNKRSYPRPHESLYCREVQKREAGGCASVDPSSRNCQSDPMKGCCSRAAGGDTSHRCTLDHWRNHTLRWVQ